MLGWLGNVGGESHAKAGGPEFADEVQRGGLLDIDAKRARGIPILEPVAEVPTSAIRHHLAQSLGAEHRRGPAPFFVRVDRATSSKSVTRKPNAKPERVISGRFGNRFTGLFGNGAGDYVLGLLGQVTYRGQRAREECGGVVVAHDRKEAEAKANVEGLQL
eukprot:g11598.t1